MVICGCGTWQVIIHDAALAHNRCRSVAHPGGDGG
jgi:hypothetical protein